MTVTGWGVDRNYTFSTQLCVCVLCVLMRCCNKWAVTKTLVISIYIGVDILPSYMGIIISHYKDPYEPTRIQWNVNRVLNVATCHSCFSTLQAWFCCPWKLLKTLRILEMELPSGQRQMRLLVKFRGSIIDGWTWGELLLVSGRGGPLLI